MHSRDGLTLSVRETVRIENEKKRKTAMEAVVKEEEEASQAVGDTHHRRYLAALPPANQTSQISPRELGLPTLRTESDLVAPK